MHSIAVRSQRDCETLRVPLQLLMVKTKLSAKCKDCQMYYYELFLLCMSLNHHFPNVSLCGQMDPPLCEEEDDNEDKDLLVSWSWRAKKSMA